MIDRPLHNIVEADLQNLVGQSESRRLEFKRDLPDNSSDSTKNFLHEVSSLANAQGGDLIIGIRDQDATAAEIVGIPAEGLNEKITALENKIRDGLEPRIPSLQIQRVLLQNERAALVLRVGASWIAPHRVKASDRFYSRNSKGKYPMDVIELRAAFAASDAMPQKIRDLHRDAVSSAATGHNLPVQMEDEAYVVLTIAPLSVMMSDLEMVVTRETAVLPPYQPNNPRLLVTLEGMLAHSRQGARSWASSHRKGYIDFAFEIAGQHPEYRSLIPSVRFHQAFYGSARAATTRLMQCGFSGPWTVMATVKHIKDHRVAWRQPDGFEATTEPAWRPSAYLGDVTVELVNDETVAPLLAAFWRLFGEPTPPQILL